MGRRAAHDSSIAGALGGDPGADLRFQERHCAFASTG
jgi:hypothetical protein